MSKFDTFYFYLLIEYFLLKLFDLGIDLLVIKVFRSLTILLIALQLSYLLEVDLHFLMVFILQIV